MRTARLFVEIAVATFLIVLLVVALVARADLSMTDCGVGAPSHPLIGDGPWIGDAKDSGQGDLMLVGCWNGSLDGDSDVDVFDYTTHNGINNIQTVPTTGGCIRVSFFFYENLNDYDFLTCQDGFDTILGSHHLRITMYDGDGDYSIGVF